MYFYLPIYKETKEQFEARYEKAFTKRVSELEDQTSGDVSARMKFMMKDQLAKEMGRSWRENHAIGWIRIGKGKVASLLLFRNRIPKSLGAQSVTLI